MRGCATFHGEIFVFRGEMTTSGAESAFTSNLALALLILSFCVIFHASVLFGMAKLIFTDLVVELRHKSAALSLVIFSSLCLCVILLNGVEIAIWAFLYHNYGSVESIVGAFIHSMGAFTTYGNSRYLSDEEWDLITHIEAMNGLVAFGLTTAFLYSASGRLHELAK